MVQVALAALEGDPGFAGLVTDINFGRPPVGWDVATRAREISPTTAVVYITGDSGHEWSVRGVPRSIVVTKPFAPLQIAAALAAQLKAGNGATPKATDVVRIHYHGTLTDGTVFDSSVRRNEPAEFPVNRVIPGWTQALQKMKVGDKWELYIPYELAYGEAGRPTAIPPASLLVFEIELLDVK